jgi:hypothetical protein
MPRFVHILKPDACALAAPVIEQNAAEPDARVTVVLLHGAPAPSVAPSVTVRRLAPGDLDHAGLLELIFESDHVLTW